MASARRGGCQPHRACLASCRAPGHPRAPEEGARGPVLPPALGLGCPGPPGANRSGPAGAHSPPPTDHGRAQLRPLARPPVPEGPHGDAVFPHEAPHAAAALHAWRVGSGQLGPTALPSGPGRLRPGGWLSGHFLLHGGRETEKARSAGRGRPSRTPAGPSLPPCAAPAPPGRTGLAHPTPRLRRHNLALLASRQEPAVALGQGSSESLGGPGEGRPPRAPGWPSVQRPAWDGEGGGREARAVRILRQLPRGLNPTPARRGPAHRGQDEGAVCPGSQRKPGWTGNKDAAGPGAQPPRGSPSGRGDGVASPGQPTPRREMTRGCLAPPWPQSPSQPTPASRSPEHGSRTHSLILPSARRRRFYHQLSWPPWAGEGTQGGLPSAAVGSGRVPAVSGRDPRWMECPALAPCQLLPGPAHSGQWGLPRRSRDSRLLPTHGPQGAPKSRWDQIPHTAAAQRPPGLPSPPQGARGSGRASPAHRRSGRLGPDLPGSPGQSLVLGLDPARPGPGLCRMGNFAADSSPIPTVGTAAACSSGPYTGKELSLRKEAGLRQRPRPPAGLRIQILSPCYQTPPQQAPTCPRSLPRHSEEVAAHSLLECPWMPPATGTSLPLKVGHSSALRKLSLGVSPPAAPHSKQALHSGAYLVHPTGGSFLNTCCGHGRACLHISTHPCAHRSTHEPSTDPSIHPHGHTPPPTSVPTIHPSITDPLSHYRLSYHPTPGLGVLCPRRVKSCERRQQRAPLILNPPPTLPVSPSLLTRSPGLHARCVASLATWSLV